MLETTAAENKTITLGYSGENETRSVIFTYPHEWLTEFPGGEIELHVKRSGDGAVYKAEQITDNSEDCELTWTITATELSYPGTGEVQLCYVKDGQIIKSQRYMTRVNNSTAAAEPTEPPPDTLIGEAVSDYLAHHVGAVTVTNTGSAGDILKSNGDGSYSWFTVSDPVVNSDDGVTLVPTRVLNRLAQAIRSKTHYEGELTVEAMAQAIEDTELWSTEDYCLGIAPAGELTINLAAVPAYMLYGRTTVSKVSLPNCTRINASAFQNSAVGIVEAPNVAYLMSNTFYSDTSLNEADFPNLMTTEGTSNFASCFGLIRVNFPKLKYIASSTFSSCYSLVECYLPKLVNVTGLVTTVDSVFNSCRVIERIELPKFEGTIRTTWFQNCWNLRELILPKLKAVTGTNNFQNCYALEKLYAPECVTWAANNFSRCDSLKRLCLYTKPTTITATSFNAPALEDIYVSWNQGEVANAPWGAPATCRVHYNTVFEDGEPIE